MQGTDDPANLPTRGVLVLPSRIALLPPPTSPTKIPSPNPLTPANPRRNVPNRTTKRVQH